MLLGIPTRSLTLVIGAFIIVAFVGFFTVTQVRAHVGPADPGQIHSCVNNASGQIEIIGADESCRNNWSPLDWFGSAGASGLERIETGFLPTTADSQSPKTAVATCPAGKFAFGGGFSISGGGPDVAVRVNAPQYDPPTGWVVTAVEVNPTDTTWQVQAFANCAN